MRTLSQRQALSQRAKKGHLTRLQSQVYVCPCCDARLKWGEIAGHKCMGFWDQLVLSLGILGMSGTLAAVLYGVWVLA